MAQQVAAAQQQQNQQQVQQAVQQVIQQQQTQQQIQQQVAQQVQQQGSNATPASTVSTWSTSASGPNNVQVCKQKKEMK